jgi:acyl-phosphate glycerol 3-phosphate acyltransferase
VSLSWPYAAALAAASYLYASINWAVLVTRRVLGQDIRTLGTGNPGTANVGRHLGRGWGALVYFLDLSKGLLPLFAGRLLLFGRFTPWSVAVLGLTGIAAIAGHCRPIFYRFRGGGGIVTAMGVFLFFIPVEFFASVLLGFAAAMSFRRRVRFAVGQWTPILFLTITPFLTLALNRALRIPLGGGWSVGGHPWYLLVVLFATSFFILGMNLRFMMSRAEEIGARQT